MFSKMKESQTISPLRHLHSLSIAFTHKDFDSFGRTWKSCWSMGRSHCWCPKGKEHGDTSSSHGSWNPPKLYRPSPIVCPPVLAGRWEMWGPEQAGAGVFNRDKVWSYGGRGPLEIGTELGKWHLEYWKWDFREERNPQGAIAGSYIGSRSREINTFASFVPSEKALKHPE